MLGAKIAKAGAVPAEGGTTPSESTPEDVARAQKQQRLLQWATPTLTGLVIVLGSQQGEQQRPGGRLAGRPGTYATAPRTVGSPDSRPSTHPTDRRL